MSAEEEENVPAEEAVEEAAEEAKEEEAAEVLPKPDEDQKAVLADIKAPKKAKKKKKSKGKGKKGGKKKKKKPADDEKEEAYDPNKPKYPKTEAGKKKAKKAFGKFQKGASYQEQVEFFLNAMWDTLNLTAKKKTLSVGPDKASMSGKTVCVEIYDSIAKFEEYAQDGGGGPKNACDLDEFQTAKYFESQDKDGKVLCGKTMTRGEKTKAFKLIDVDNNKRFSLLEVLIWFFDIDICDLMSKPQGTNEQLKIAEKALKEALQIIGDLEAEKSEKREIIAESKKPDSKVSGVKGAKAAAELAQLESKDPTHLNRLLITAEAALRKAKKSKNLFAMGKQWVLSYELQQAKNYKPGNKKIGKGRFSVSATKAKKRKKKGKKKAKA